MTAGQRWAVAALLGAAALTLATVPATATGTAARAVAAAPSPSADSIELGVVVAPRATPTGTRPPRPTPSHPTPPRPSRSHPGGPLPRTGLALGAIALAGVVTIGGGATLRLVARRRSDG